MTVAEQQQFLFAAAEQVEKCANRTTHGLVHNIGEMSAHYVECKESVQEAYGESIFLAGSMYRTIANDIHTTAETVQTMIPELDGIVLLLEDAYRNTLAAVGQHVLDGQITISRANEQFAVIRTHLVRHEELAKAAKGGPHHQVANRLDPVIQSTLDAIAVSEDAAKLCNQSAEQLRAHARSL